MSSLSVMVKGIMLALDSNTNKNIYLQSALATLFVTVVTAILLLKPSSGTKKRGPSVLKDLVDKCSPPVGYDNVGVADMFTGGSGSWNTVKGVTTGRENVKTWYVINYAESSSDKIVSMIGDGSF